MAYIGQDPVIGRYILVDQISGGFNGTASGFTLAAGGQGVIPGLAQNVLLSLGGVIQQPGTDYTVSGSGITFTTPPLSGTTFFATVLGDVQAVGTPSDGTVLPASIATSGTFVFPNITTTGTTLIASGNASTPSLAIIGDTNTGLYSPGADQVAISTGGTGRLFVDASGRVGVGVAPSAPLEVNGEVRFTRSGVASQYVGVIADGTDTRIFAEGSSKNLSIKNNSTTSSVILFDQAVASSYIFNQAGSERMRLDSSGRLGVGTSAPGYKFEVDNVGGSTATARLVGNDQANVRLRIQNTGSGGRAYEIVGGLNGVNNSHLSVYDATAAATRLTITDTGLVGIGTSSPDTIFSVQNVRSDTAGSGWFTYTASATSGKRGLRVDSNNGFCFDYYNGSSWSQQAVIDSSGRVGIGSNSPVTALDVRGEVSVDYNASYGLRFYNQDRNNWSSIGNNIATGVATANLVFKDSTGEVARMAGGRLLVGTSSAQGVSKFQIQGTTSDSTEWGGLFIRRGLATASIIAGFYLGQIDFGNQDGGVGALIRSEADAQWGTNDYPGRLVFSTTADGASSPTERMRIGQQGNVGIGAVNSASIRLYIKGAGATGSSYSFYLENGVGTEAFYVRDDGAVATGTLGGSPYNNTTGSAANVFVTSSGLLQRSTSSIKYKRNIVDAVHGLPELLQLRAVTYQSKADTDGDIKYGGFIAEEVDAVGLSEFVQYAEDGTPDALAYGNMVSLCIKAIQEQQAMIVELQAEVAALKGA